MNIFSKTNLGKTIVYYGHELDVISDGEVFEVTNNPSENVFQIGYGASLVHLINEDKHISLCGSSRIINDCFFDLIKEPESVEEKPNIPEILYKEKIVENPVYGIDGEAGPQGFPGIPGRDGADGVDGINGENGSQGDQGLQGEPGSQGDQGIQGERGESGEQGLQGERGKDGEDGRDGVDGRNGSDGVQGVEGEQGVQGEQGERGERGEKGENGEDGKQGPIGTSGIAGPKGEIGPAGNDGVDGKDGEQGEKGEDGIAQVSGPLRYDKINKLLTVSEEWVNSIGSHATGTPIVGGGGDLFGVKKDGEVIPFGNAVRYLNFVGAGVTLTSDGIDAKVAISHVDIQTQALDMNGFDLYNSRIDGGSF